MKNEIRGISGSTPAGQEKAWKVRAKAKEDFRVKFSVTGNWLDRMTGMILRRSSGRLLVVKELAEEYGVSARTIHEDISRLEGWNILTFEGPPKTGKYILTEYGKAILEGAR